MHIIKRLLVNVTRALGCLSVDVIILLSVIFASLPIITSEWYVLKHLGKGYLIEMISPYECFVSYRPHYFQINNYTHVVDDVISVGKNRKWVVIKTKHADYWVINKDKWRADEDRIRQVYGPMDSVTFYKMCSDSLIGLSLITIRQQEK